MRARILCAVLLFSTTFSLGADDATLQIFVGSPSDPRLEEVLYLAAGVELTRAGLDSRRIPASLVAESGIVDRERVEEEAREFDTRYVLLVAYTARDRTIDIDFSLYDTTSESPIATSELVSPIDIDLDARVGRAVRALIEAAGVERERTAATSLEGIGLAQRPTPPTLEEPASVSGGAPVHGLEFGVNTAGLFLMGPASDYFAYGVAGSLNGAYAPRFDSIGAGFGGRASVLRMFPAEGVVGGDLHVVTLGPEAFVGTRYRAPARLGARASGGAAVLVVSHSEETLAKTVPYVDAGIAARLPLSSLFAIGIEINYLLVMEAGFPVMGLSPSITVSMEP